MDRSYSFLLQAGALIDQQKLLDALADLDPLQFLEWADLLVLKCNELHNNRHRVELKRTLSLLVQGCLFYRALPKFSQNMSLSAQARKVEQLIVMAYTQQDCNKYQPLLSKLGFDTSGSEVLTYDEGVFTKMWYGIKEIF